MPRPKKEQPNRKDGLYEVKITTGKTLDGKLIRKSFYSSISKDDARRQAEEWKINQKVAQQTGTVFVEKYVTFADWARKWLEVYVKGKVKSNTYSSDYDILLRLHIIPHFGNAALTDIKPIDIQKFLDTKAKTMSAERVKKLKARLKNIFETAIENELCYTNPVTSSIKIIPQKEKVEKRFYTFKQRDLVVEYAKNHKHGLPIILMLYTGLSRSELLGLKWDDINDDYSICINRGVTVSKDQFTEKTTLVVDDSLKNMYRKRTIPIPKWIYDMVIAKPHEVRLGGSFRNKTPLKIVQTEYIFHNSKGEVQNPNHFSVYVYKKFMDDMVAYYGSKGIRIDALNPHELRHTAATLWALDGVDLYTIARLGGWSDLKMIAKVYGHSDTQVMRNALKYDVADEKTS